jgi:hypothetical protein
MIETFDNLFKNLCRINNTKEDFRLLWYYCEKPDSKRQQLLVCSFDESFYLSPQLLVLIF